MYPLYPSSCLRKGEKMSNVPAFHYRAVEEAEARTKAARNERDRAQSFLSELDDVLDEVVGELLAGKPDAA